jgi:hypothetical protein
LKVNFLAERLRKTPIAKSPTILKKLLSLKGLFLLIASGTAIPIIKRNEGKIRSAGVRPFH